MLTVLGRGAHQRYVPSVSHFFRRTHRTRESWQEQVILEKVCMSFHLDFLGHNPVTIRQLVLLFNTFPHCKGSNSIKFSLMFDNLFSCQSFLNMFLSQILFHAACPHHVLRAVLGQVTREPHSGPILGVSQSGIKCCDYCGLSPKHPLHH